MALGLNSRVTPSNSALGNGWRYNRIGRGDSVNVNTQILPKPALRLLRNGLLTVAESRALPFAIRGKHVQIVSSVQVSKHVANCKLLCRCAFSLLDQVLVEADSCDAHAN